MFSMPATSEGIPSIILTLLSEKQRAIRRIILIIIPIALISLYQQQNYQYMRNSQIPGSSPKKLIKRTILTNPSLISVSVTSIFDPQNQSLPKIYDAYEKKQQLMIQNQSRVMNELSPAKFARESSLQEKPRHQASKQLDSLQQAEQQFMSKKNSQQQIVSKEENYKSPILLKREMSKELSFLSRGSSMPALNHFHYNTSNEIKVKQSKHYNIISNL